MFYQEAPRLPANLLDVDDALQAELRRALPATLRRSWWPRLQDLGREAATALDTLGREAEARPPRHVPYDPWGRRVDHIEVSPAWQALQAAAARHAIVATGHDEALGRHRRVLQAALLYLYSGSSATFSCPLAMTDAAATVLRALGPTSLRERLRPRLTSLDPATFITSGQWMTERSGGSDVGGTETLARPLGQDGDGDRYALHGVKWFTSATTAEMALTLARIDDGVHPPPAGSRGLTLFCVEIARDGDGALRGIAVHRLKDKLGTRALPTAELTLDGTVATRLSEPGRGVAAIATMLNVTRYYNAVASASGMARAVWLARDYAQRRRAFGAALAELPLHARTLAQLDAVRAGALGLCFEVAGLLGAVEAGEASEAERRRLRGLIPLAKLCLGKQAVAVASEALECFGGAGYIEDTDLPRLLRDAQVLAIWEGTTNVLALDLLRGERTHGALGAVLDDLAPRVEALDPRLGQPARDLARGLLTTLRTRVAAAAGERAEALAVQARDLAMTCAQLVEVVHLAETAATQDARLLDAATLLATSTLGGPLAT